MKSFFFSRTAPAKMDLEKFQFDDYFLIHMNTVDFPIFYMNITNINLLRMLS